MIDADVAIRAARPDDAVDGVLPEGVCEPLDGGGLAAALQAASRDGRPTVLRGGGTKLGWGRVAPRIGLVVSTARLAPRLIHRDGDLTATVGAGVTLAALNQHLAAKGQWLPVESAFAGATIGGVIAANDAGPLRHRYGTPRDLLIGVTLALADGRLVKAGGTVVKNVAGYDLGRFVSGSFGTLAAIVDATFKLLPVPRVSRTIVCRYPTGERLASDVAALAASQLEPAACDVRTGGAQDLPSSGRACALLLRFASSPSSTEAQVAAAGAGLSGETEILSGAAEAALWADQVQSAWLDGERDAARGAPAAVVRVSWLPARLGAVLGLLEDMRSTAGAITLTGRAIVGTGLLVLPGSVREQIAAIERLRSEVDTVGHVVILRADHAVKAAVDVWGPLGGAAASLASLKHSLDPAGILNAARGPI
jgi:glycolate oxidase FAD binding subunit